jgi:EAL domain-containing protein (putative c-di-GMP-specific phosphodiesterase class I)
MDSNATRYEIELDLLERRPDLDDRAAIALLRSDFRLALNASHFIALSADDPEIDIVSRTIPQEGVARYELTLEFVERRAMSEQQAIALVYSEFQRAINASYFWRLSDDDPTVEVVSRAPVVEAMQWRRAA